MPRRMFTREEFRSAARELALARAAVNFALDHHWTLKDSRQMWRALQAIDMARSDLDSAWYRQYPDERSPFYPAFSVAEMIAELEVKP